MFNNKYSIENYINPELTYGKLSDKLKLGQLIFNAEDNKIEKINLKILEDIIKFELIKGKRQKYFLLNLFDNWLTEIFDFDKKFLAPQNMTVFTSRKHGLKIHSIRDYRIGYAIKEKIQNGVYKGEHSYKPLVKTVNELMDHLYLIKREEFDFSKEEIVYINKFFEEELKK